MNRLLHRGLALSLVLGLGFSVAACGAKNKDESSKKDDDDKKDKKKDKGDDDGKKSKKSKKDKDKVDIKALLDDGGKEKEGMLKVKLPDDSKDVPVIGGDPPSKSDKADKPDDSEAAKTEDPEPSAPASGPWFEMNDLKVAQLDWTKKDYPNAEMLTAKSGKAVLVLIPFDTEEHGQEQLKGAIERMQAVDLKWSSEPKQVKLGADELSAFIGTGHAKIGDTHSPAKLLFAEIKTGKPLNLLVIGIADEDAPEADLNAGEQILTTVKLK
jgi:hypothetical protein